MKFFAYIALVATASAVQLHFNQEEETFLDVEALADQAYTPSEVWKHFDKNGDGEWSRKEARTAYKEIHEHFGHKLEKGWKKDFSEMFTAIDEDKSGKISAMEMFIYVASQIDANNDGKWTFKEIKQSIKALAEFTGGKLKKDWKDMVKHVFDQIDTDGNGYVDQNEGMAAAKMMSELDFSELFEGTDKKLDLQTFLGVEADAEFDPEELWKAADGNGNGTLSLGEVKSAFKYVMKKYKHKLWKGWEADLEAEFKEMDQDGSGEVEKMEMLIYIAGKIDSNNDNQWSLQEIEGAVEFAAKFTRHELVDGWKEMVKTAFDKIDANGDGHIQPNEALKELKKNGIPDFTKLFK